MKNLAFAHLLFFSVLAFASPTIPVFLSEEDARKWVDETWYPAWVGGAPAVEKLLPLFTPTATYIDPNVPQGITGHAALRRFFRVMLANNPDWKFTTQGLYPTEKGFVLHWLGKVPFQGKVIDLRGVDIFRFGEDGLIVHLEEFFDLSQFRPSTP